jgi:hypothetical protein
MDNAPPSSMKRKRTTRSRLAKRAQARLYWERTAPRGSRDPKVSHLLKARVADSINLERLNFGRRRSDYVRFRDDTMRSSVYFWEDGRIWATGPHALAMATTAVAFLVRSGIAPNASLASLKTAYISVLGRSRNANL